MGSDGQSSDGSCNSSSGEEEGDMGSDGQSSVASQESLPQAPQGDNVPSSDILLDIPEESIKWWEVGIQILVSCHLLKLIILP